MDSEISQYSRRDFIKTLGAAALALTPLRHFSKTYVPKYQTFAHRILNLESGYFPISDGHYQLIDDIIDSVKAMKTSNKPEEVLQNINDVLVDYDFIYEINNDDTTFGSIYNKIKMPAVLREHVKDRMDDFEDIAGIEPGTIHNVPFGLLSFAKMRKNRLNDVVNGLDKEYRRGECDTISFIYYAIGEVLDMPLRLVIAPHHVFVRHAGKKPFNWETLGAETVEDKIYSENLTQTEINSGAYMRGLSGDEAFAIPMNNLALQVEREGCPAEALELINESIEKNPSIAESYLVKAYILNSLAQNGGDEVDFHTRQELRTQYHCLTGNWLE